MDKHKAPDIRETRVVIYMTEDDASFLTRLAKRMGFKGRSEMITAILERLIIGGFSGASWLKTGLQFFKRMDKTGAHAEGEMYFGVRPLPALPVESDPSSKEIRAELTEIRKQTLTEV